MVWLAWACFGLRLEDVKADEERYKELKTTLAMLEARTGTLFEEGFASDVEVIRLSLDPVNVGHLRCQQQSVALIAGKRASPHTVCPVKSCQLVAAGCLVSPSWDGSSMSQLYGSASLW